ncbi:ATP-dependent DNA helicase 2 subunit KU80 [Vitis vinifera]|uniref:ATP-dependent DNA helicase 2 subunit KU80 n=1 Tax=Vitis vinifera TaxID=29760 RepID=A0A438IW19_VITVI|nr:ATP-dependent DNA helicase 2 subunit KU80 [Vitis vinifera]
MNGEGTEATCWLECIVKRSLGENEDELRAQGGCFSEGSTPENLKSWGATWAILLVRTNSSLIMLLLQISSCSVLDAVLERSVKAVWVYKKTAEDRFPTLKQYSDQAPPTDKFATHEVKVDFEYKSVEESSKVVPQSKGLKGVKLLGFTDASNVMRHYYMHDVNIFIAEPGNTKAMLAVSALARAMKEMNKVAILRCVWRQGQGSVVIGILTPNVSDKDDIPDSFYFNVLPYAEDVREFQFPSFSNLPASWQPNEEQQEAADNLVKMLDLAPSGSRETLLPDLTPNPVLERFYRHLELKSKHPDAAVPPLDESLKKITEPDPELLSQNKPIIDAFRRRFELKENPKLKKSTRRLFRDRPSGLNEEASMGDGSDGQAIKSIENTSTVGVEKIGDSTPIQDFEAMMSRRDSPEWVGKAINEMKNKIFDLVEDSYEGDNYLKALEYLVALRKGCVLEQEPKQFNDFLHHLYKYCEKHNLNSFCESLASKEIMLINKTEAADSEVTEDEARSLMVKKEPKLE